MRKYPPTIMTEITNEQITANIETWCQALESGDYVQDIGFLNSGHGFCCIGVACEALSIPKEDFGDAGSISYDGCDTLAPTSLMEKLGMMSDDGTFTIEVDGEIVETSLVAKNDDHGWNFKQIADLIRSRPKGLFIEGV